MSPFANDPYCYPGTDVLRNLAEIRDPKALERFEADATAANIIELRRNLIKGPFDTDRLQETHRRIFGNVYPWAGRIPQGHRHDGEEPLRVRRRLGAVGKRPGRPR